MMKKDPQIKKTWMDIFYKKQVWYAYFDSLKKAFKSVIPFFSCDVSQSLFEIYIKILLKFPRQNELIRPISETLGGALQTSLQSKKQKFSRKIHVLQELCPKQNKI